MLVRYIRKNADRNMNNDTRQIRKAAITDTKEGEAPKPRPRAPLEKVPGETVLELLEKGKIKEVAAMGRAAVPALIEQLRKGTDLDYTTRQRIRFTLMMMGFEMRCIELMNHRNIRSGDYSEGSGEYVRKLLDKNKDFESLKRCSVKREPILGNLKTMILGRFLEEAPHLILLKYKDGLGGFDFADVEVVGVDPNNVEKLFSIMCVMDEYLFDTLMRLCLPVSERIRAMILNAGPQAIPVLINGLSNEDEDVRYRVIDMLAAMGEPAVLPLMAVLADGNSKGRGGAAEALGRIGDIRAVPALIEAAKRKEEDELQYGIIAAVGEIAKKHPEYDWRAVAMVLVDLLYSCGDAVCQTLEIIGAVTTDSELKRILKEKGY